MSYDNTNEISNNYISIKLLNMIKDKYNLQKSSPIIIYIMSDH